MKRRTVSGRAELLANDRRGKRSASEEAEGVEAGERHNDSSEKSK